MIDKIGTMKINKALVIPGTVITAVMLILLIGFISFIQFQKARQDLEGRSALIQRLFAENVTQALLLGQNAVVYTQCKALSKEPLVAGVIVKDYQGEPICSFGNTSGGRWEFSRTSTVSFGESRAGTAGEIEIRYDLTPLRSQLITIALLGASLSLIAIFFQGLIYGFLAKLIALPIGSLVTTLGTRDLQKILESKNVSYGMPIEIQEINSLNNEIGEMAAEIIKLQNIAVEAEKQKAVSLIAAQVSHDIRSPLSALNMVVSALKEVPEEKRIIIRNAAQRINDIANSLLKQSKKSSIKQVSVGNDFATYGNTINKIQEPVFLTALLDGIVSEKREQFRENRAIDIRGDLSQSYGLFVKVDPTELARAISNLVVNSVEAIEGKGSVLIAVRPLKDAIAIMISDDGRGIPEDVIARIGERGFSYGKKVQTSGSGLGIYHARRTAEAYHGTLEIQSKVGKGTILTMVFPEAEPPKWFVRELLLKPDMNLVSVDDDQLIHEIWRIRLDTPAINNANVKHISLSDPEQFRLWMQAESVTNFNNSLILMDYEFVGQGLSGLDLIETSGCASRAILVTSKYDDPTILHRAETLGLHILPKASAHLVPFNVAEMKSPHSLNC